MDREDERKTALQVDQEKRHPGRADLPGAGELSRPDLSEPAQPGEVCGAEHRPDHRGSRLQWRLRHTALGRLCHRQGEAGSPRSGPADRRPVRRELAVAEITLRTYGTKNRTSSEIFPRIKPRLGAVWCAVA